MSNLESLNSCQKSALSILDSHENVFLTGVAGSGKSFLVRHFLAQKSSDSFPVLASTGAAAILVGGRTFHSFFGLGIMQGGFEATVERALSNKKLQKRLKKTIAVIIDEVSMLSGTALRAAETICRKARGKQFPWGGIRVIAVGDFAQLPPVSAYNQPREWAFLDETWLKSDFRSAVLRTIVRTQDTEFQEILNFIRSGVVNERVTRFLNERKVSDFMDMDEAFEGTRLFPHRDTTEKFNLLKLSQLEGQAQSIPTVYSGNEKSIQDLKRNAPIPEILRLKEGALVMLRINDPKQRFVNGSLASIEKIEKDSLKIRLQAGNRICDVETTSFSLLDAEGKEVASARNFPLNLAYATTIHKAQGMTLDALMVDLRNLWEPGQAYVALSRVKSANNVFVTDWNSNSIKMDPRVAEFYREAFAYEESGYSV